MLRVLLNRRSVSEECERDFFLLLQDMTMSSVLLLGSKSEFAEFDSLLKKIKDPGLQARALAVAKRLKDDNRLLSCDDLGASLSCQFELFDCPTERAASDLIISDASPGDGRRFVKLEEYLKSQWPLLVRRHDFSFVERSTRRQWEVNIWRPLFRNARLISIIDHIAGIDTAEFEPTLRWLDCLMVNNSAPRRTVTLYTTVRGDRSKITALCKQLGWKLQLRLYAPNHPQSLPHERYIVTERVGLQIGRGLNLCYSDSDIVRDSSAHICANASSIINKAHNAKLLDRA